jgi:peptidylprolyl isomerase
VVEDFVSQGGKHMSGAPTPGYTIKNETYTENPAIAELKHSKAGMLAMARTMRPHTNGAQWYITHDQIKDLDGDYTVFGEVTKGLDIALKLNTGTKITDVSISSDTSQVYKVYKDRIKEWNAILDRNFFNLRKLEEKK